MASNASNSIKVHGWNSKTRSVVTKDVNLVRSQTVGQTLQDAGFESKTVDLAFRSDTPCLCLGNVMAMLKAMELLTLSGTPCLAYGSGSIGLARLSDLELRLQPTANLPWYIGIGTQEVLDMTTLKGHKGEWVQVQATDARTWTIRVNRVTDWAKVVLLVGGGKRGKADKAQ